MSSKREYVYEEMGYLDNDEITHRLEITRKKVNQHPTNGAQYYRWIAKDGEGYSATDTKTERLTLTMADESEYILRLPGRKLNLTAVELDDLRSLLEVIGITEGDERMGHWSRGRVIEKPQEPNIIGEIR
jgi:hypothetical protein